MPSTRNVAMSRPRRVRRIAEIVAENSWPPVASSARKTSDAGRIIHHPPETTAALDVNSRTGTIVDAATKLAAARPATIWFGRIGRTASCWGSRFSSRGKMMTGRVTQTKKVNSAAHPMYSVNAAGLRLARV